MSVHPYHRRFHSDALAGFMSLNLEERGAYQTLLDMIYDRGGPLLDNDRLLAGYMGASVRKWRALREALIQKGKIYLTSDGLLSNRRADQELENLAKTSRKQAENGSSGGRKKAENAKYHNEINDPAVATAKPDPSQSYSLDSLSKERGVAPHENGRNEDALTEVPATLAARLWGDGLGYLIQSGIAERSARSQLGKWRKHFGDAQLLELLAHCQAKAMSNPSAYIEAASRRGGGDPPDQQEGWLRLAGNGRKSSANPAFLREPEEFPGSGWLEDQQGADR